MADNVEAEQKERYIDTVDPDDPQYERDLRRPANIKADMKDMERSKRVSLILNSQAFREELEAIIETQLKVRNLCHINLIWIYKLQLVAASLDAEQVPYWREYNPTFE